ncbi:putative nuclease HARBI1 [Temnothorax nylanderi]|uniref:putative nuclease HARBI1 n=1 Tax=Temnothorax nylanderi TaxID=102681 RepID=UPI003A894F3E
MEMYRQLNNARKNIRRILPIMKKRQHHTRPGLYSEVWVDLYLENDFFLTFRLKRETFQQLLQLVTRQDEMQKVYTGGYEPVQPHKVQQIALYYLAHQISMTQIGDKFDVATSTISHCVTTWINCVLKLVPTLIQWPTINERVSIEEKFRNLAGFPGVIGAIDGCHLNVMAPSMQQKCYQNRYMTHSIILQGICTADCLLTNVYVGHPGSANDCRVLSNSSLYVKIEQNGYSQYFLPNQHLLGDKIYPIKEWFLPPFKDYGNMTRMQITYNKIHSKTRVKIENCFGLLKGRWRRLIYIYIYYIYVYI